MYTRISALTLLIFLIISGCQGPGNVSPAPVFGDHMVLQANNRVNVWGISDPGARIEVTFRDQVKKGSANGEGRWQIILDSMEYGGPDSMVITGGPDRIVYRDVLVGEVWLCSGQSNMEMPLISDWARLNNAEEEVSNADYPGIRLFTVERNLTFQPVDTMVTDGWQDCSPESAKDFSATAYFFGREIHRTLGIPVGLIHSSWGGTVAEAWTSAGSLSTMEDFKEQVGVISNIRESKDSLRAQYRRDMRKMIQEMGTLDVGIDGTDTIFASDRVVVSDWITLNLPVMWEQTALGNFDGSCWFIKDIELSNSIANSELTLCYGATDDWDEAWFNGVRVGSVRAWNVPREFPVPKGVAKPGMNRIVIRVMDTGGAGGFMGERKHFVLRSSNGRSIPIADGWRAKKGFDMRDVTTRPVSVADPNQPTVLFNAMIHPLIPYTIRGVIWYQGESNAGSAYQYRELFKTLIIDWRKQWGEGDFPFLFVQLANYMKRNKVPVEDTWAELREAQTMALQLPHTGMAVTIDIGNANDIHPGNKQEVGRRLALNALALVYDRDIPYSGPIYKSYVINGPDVVISFDHVVDGLGTSDGGELQGFSIAGPDHQFVWADARIKGDRVIVRSAQVKEPVAVRYGWSSNPACNLVNSAGLPASPFRTDQFRGITQPD